MYWTRDILHFFGIKEEDISVFLNFHQVYKYYMSKRLESKSLAPDGFDRLADRAGSYWARSEVHAGSDADRRSYKMMI